MAEAKSQSARAAFEELIATPNLPALGPAPRPGVESLASLNQKLDAFFGRFPNTSSRGDAIRCAALLWHDHLDAAHGLAQHLANADGSFLHGIVHRREPDYANAKYWFRRVGKHPAYPIIATTAAKFLRSKSEARLAATLAPHDTWDPLAFVDLCEAAARLPEASPQTQLLREIQRIEFAALVDSLLSAE